MNVLNPYVRQFLVGWITVLDSVPDIDMLGFLPDFLDGNYLLFRTDRLFFFCSFQLYAYAHDSLSNFRSVQYVK